MTTPPNPSPSGGPTIGQPSGNIASVVNSTLDQLKAAYAAAGGGSRTNPWDITYNSLLYMPTDEKPPKGSKTPGHLRGRKRMTVGEAMHSIWGWSDQQAKRFSELAVNAGYLKESTIDRTALAPIWQRLVEASAGTYGNGGTSTPWELLARYARGGQAAESLARTRTSRSYSVVSALTAEELAHAALSERLGRQATESELAEFKAELAKAEKKNPTVTTTTTDEEGVVTSTSTQEGLNYQMFASNYALEHNKDEATAYQAAGQMMPWFFEALGAPV